MVSESSPEPPRSNPDISQPGLLRGIDLVHEGTGNLRAVAQDLGHGAGAFPIRVGIKPTAAGFMAPMSMKDEGKVREESEGGRA